jgi:O-antigen ligase
MNYILNAKKNNLKFLLQLLYCLIPVSLITGSLFPDLIVSLISALFLFKCLRERKFSYFNNKFFLIFFLFYLILIISSLISNSTFNNSIIFYIRFGIFVVAASYLIEIDKKFINMLFTITFLTFLILCLDSYFQYFFGINISGNAYPGIYISDFPRLNSFFGNEYKLGSFIVRLLPFLIFVFLIYSRASKFILFALLLLLSGIVFLSGERSSLVLLIVTIFFLFFFFKRFNFLVWLISLLMFFFLLYNLSFFKGHKTRVIDLSSTLYSKNINIEEKNVKIKEKNFNIKENIGNFIKNPLLLLNDEYKFIYSNTIRIFKDNPFLGSGPKSYRVECKKYDPKACSTHPHQTYLQLLSEVGLFGFLFVLFIFFYSIFSYFKHLKNNSYVSFIYLGIIINIWPLTSSGNFFNNWLSVIIFFPLGFLLTNKEKI